MSENLVQLIVIGAILLFGWITRRMAEKKQQRPSGRPPPEAQPQSPRGARKAQMEDQLRDFFRQMEARSRGEMEEPEPPPEPADEPARPSPSEQSAGPTGPTAPQRRAQVSLRFPISSMPRQPVGAEEGEPPRLSIEQTIQRDLADRVGKTAEKNASELALKEGSRWENRKALTSRVSDTSERASTSAPSAQALAEEGRGSSHIALPFSLRPGDLRSVILLTEILGPPTALRPPGESVPGLRDPRRG